MVARFTKVSPHNSLVDIKQHVRIDHGVCTLFKELNDIHTKYRHSKFHIDLHSSTGSKGKLINFDRIHCQIYEAQSSIFVVQYQASEPKTEMTELTNPTIFCTSTTHMHPISEIL